MCNHTFFAQFWAFEEVGWVTGQMHDGTFGDALACCLLLNKSWFIYNKKPCNKK